MLLVPKHVTEIEILFIDISKNEMASINAAELAHIFKVTVQINGLKTLYDWSCKEWLFIELLAEPNVILIQRKLQLEKMPSKTIIQYEGLAKNACDIYQEGIVSPRKLQNLLALIEKNQKTLESNYQMNFLQKKI